MLTFEIGGAYSIKGKESWKEYSVQCIVMGFMGGEVIDSNPDVNSQVMLFFSESYQADPGLFESLVIKGNTRIIQAYNLAGLDNIPDTMDDITRVVYIPEIVISLNDSDFTAVSQKSVFSINSIQVHNKEYNPIKMLEKSVKMEAAIQSVCPGYKVAFQHIGYKFMPVSEIDAEETKETAALNEVYRIQTAGDRKYRDDMEDISKRTKLLEKNTAEAASLLKYANDRFAEVFGQANLMMDCLNKISNHMKWEDLPDFSVDEVANLKDIQNGEFFK